MDDPGHRLGSTAVTGAALSAPSASLTFGWRVAAADAPSVWHDQTAIFNAGLTNGERAYLYNGGAGVSYATLKAAAGH